LGAVTTLSSGYRRGNTKRKIPNCERAEGDGAWGNDPALERIENTHVQRWKTSKKRDRQRLGGAGKKEEHEQRKRIKERSSEEA